MSAPDIETHLCLCGKRGWTDRADADRVHRKMRGRSARDPRREQLHLYRCDRTDSGMWHVGHDRSRVKS